MVVRLRVRFLEVACGLLIASCSGGGSPGATGDGANAYGSGGLGSVGTSGIAAGVASGGQPALGGGGTPVAQMGPITGSGGANGTAGASGAGAGSGGTIGSGGTSGSAGASGAGSTSGSGGMSGTGGASGSGGNSGSGGTSGSGGNSGSGGTSGDSGPGKCRTESTHMGGLTQYDQTALGNCGMPWPSNDLYAAMATDDYQSSAVCGMCVEITGPTGLKAVVQAVDQCPVASNPKCVAGHIDLSHTAYAAVVPSNLPGEVPNSQPVSWRYVACNANGPIVYHFKDGTSANWLALQVRNSRYGIAKIRWRKGGGSWQDMSAPTNTLAYFVANGPSTTTYDLEVTDVNGQVLEDNGVQLVPNGDAQGHAQFPNCMP
jgi:expansin (peptidoglycan-binding protein)